MNVEKVDPIKFRQCLNQVVDSYKPSANIHPMSSVMQIGDAVNVIVANESTRTFIAYNVRLMALIKFASKNRDRLEKAGLLQKGDVYDMFHETVLDAVARVKLNADDSISPREFFREYKRQRHLENHAQKKETHSH